jgi:hypothetical protein
MRRENSSAKCRTKSGNIFGALKGRICSGYLDIHFDRNRLKTVEILSHFQPCRHLRLHCVVLLNHKTFGVLFCFFVIRHDRRRILHFNITKHPTSSWIMQQLREAFPFGAAPRFLIHGRDAKYGTEVPAAIRSLKVNAVQDLVRKSLAEGSRFILHLLRTMHDVLWEASTF